MLSRTKPHAACCFSAKPWSWCLLEYTPVTARPRLRGSDVMGRAGVPCGGAARTDALMDVDDEREAAASVEPGHGAIDAQEVGTALDGTDHAHPGATVIEAFKLFHMR